MRTLTRLIALLICLIPSTASAYVGPGAGVSALGAAFALVSGVILVVIGFVWYPTKRLLQRVQQARPSSQRAAGEASR